MAWKERRIYPKLETAHIADGCEDVCSSCENWGEACETCRVCIQVECDFGVKEITMDVVTLCGIPIGTPYEVGREYII